MLKLAISLAIVASMSLVPAVGVAQESPAQAAARLGRRSIDTRLVSSSGSVRAGRAMAVIDAPFDVVMAAITDYGRYRQFMPHFNRSRVLSRRGNNALVYLQARVLRGSTTLWAQTRMYARRPRGQTRIIEGRMREGNMEHFVARFEATPIDGGERTFLSFQLLIDPDLPVPASVLSDQNLRNAHRVIVTLRRYLAAHPNRYR